MEHGPMGENFTPHAPMKAANVTTNSSSRVRLVLQRTAPFFCTMEGYIQTSQMVPAQTLLQPLQQQLIVDPNGTAAGQQPTFAFQASDGSLIPVQLAASPNGGPLIMLMPTQTTGQGGQPVYTTQAITTGAAPATGTIDASGQATVLGSTVEDENNQAAALQQQQTQQSAGQVQLVHQQTVTATQAASQLMQQTAAQQSSASMAAVGQEEPLYVNAKQYNRILKRRQARGKLEAQGRIPKERRNGFVMLGVDSTRHRLLTLKELSDVDFVVFCAFYSPKFICRAVCFYSPHRSVKIQLNCYDILCLYKILIFWHCKYSWDSR
ncbi:nuclear transcription factor Y alpha [Echinococcus multilocularis]|uniref:Nuclear transcription factor Y subunit n=1 Tax=Echinococcus multilocularis TaxID=6211 RepID=A0A068YHW2_ECHMU|nr:nuclear transcription factor Y alpha [Echinococcus multilocularis]